MRSTFALVLIPLIAAAAAAEEIVDGIAAQVGSEIVLVSEVLQIAEPAEQRIRAELPDTQRVRVELNSLAGK